MLYTIAIIFTFSYDSVVSPNTVRCSGIHVPAMNIFQYEWDIPNDAGVCCSQYRVETSNGTAVIISERRFAPTDAAFNISVSCIDMLGASGTPEFLPAHEVVSKC